MPRGLDFKETVLPQRAMPKPANSELELEDQDMISVKMQYRKEFNKGTKFK